MVQRGALPAHICFDCAHNADVHRPARETGLCGGDDGSCACARTREAIERHGGDIIEERKEERRRIGYALLSALVFALAVGFGSVLASRSFAQASIRDSEQKFCLSVTFARDTEARKVAGYANDPPVTEAGKEQMEQTKTSLRAYQDLLRSLGCPQSEGKRS
jgi:hypothetical protein